MDQSSLESQPRRLYCYRYYAFTDCLVDEEAVWLDVQRWVDTSQFAGTV